MNNLSTLTKQQLLHELFFADAMFMAALKTKASDRKQARENLRIIIAEVERRKAREMM